MKPDIVVICGPTGIGKTSVTISLAGEFNGEIINADSMQLYKYMDIGTAKPTLSEREAIRHHIVDMIAPDTPFDAARFAEMADPLIHDLHGRGSLPFIAGGTGLYIKSLVDGLFRANPANPDILKKLADEAEALGLPALYDRLLTCDPVAADKIHINDAFRIIRALEIFETTGRPISEHHQHHNFSDRKYRVLKVGLTMERERLYERINKRVDIMLEEGLLNEVKNLINQGYAPSLKPMKSLGYRHMAEYLQDEKDWDEAVRTLKRDTRRYAKRQMTWFRSDQEIEWFTPDQVSDMSQRIKNFLQDKTTGQSHVKNLC